MTEILLEEKFLAELKEIFKKTVPNAQVWAYGSRVDGSAHAGSDLDLALVGEGDIAVSRVGKTECSHRF